jgi:hypothetical protein
MKSNLSILSMRLLLKTNWRKLMAFFGWTLLSITLVSLVALFVVPSKLRRSAFILTACYLGTAVVAALFLPLLTGEYYHPSDILEVGPDGRLIQKGVSLEQVGAVVTIHFGPALAATLLVAWCVTKRKMIALAISAALLFPLLTDIVYRYWWWRMWFSTMISSAGTPTLVPTPWESTWHMIRMALAYIGPAIAAGVVLVGILLLWRRSTQDNREKDSR